MVNNWYAKQITQNLIRHSDATEQDLNRSKTVLKIMLILQSLLTNLTFFMLKENFNEFKRITENVESINQRSRGQKSEKIIYT